MYRFYARKNADFLLFSYAKMFHFIKLSSVNDTALQFLLSIL